MGMRIYRSGPLRPEVAVSPALKKKVLADLAAVRNQGDRALRKGGATSQVRVDPRSLRSAFGRLHPGARAALETACRQIGAFARRELAALREFDLRPTSGLTAYHRRVPLERVGLVVPALRISALLELAIPPAVAGVAERALCVAPGPEGGVDDAVLAAAYMCDIKEMYLVEGARAVAALAFGTPTIRPVNRILGSGDAAVRLAKREVSAECAVDPGDLPRELLILADETASVELVAADLLAQAELDPDADCVLVTTSEALAKGVQAELRERTRELAKSDPARGPLGRARAFLASDLDAAVAAVNDYAPQRISLQVVRPDDLVGSLRGYGALFVGSHSPATLGEYLGGGRVAAAGGAGQGQGVLGLGSLRVPVVALEVDASGYPRLAHVAAVLADLEGRRHARRALDIRRFDPARRR